GGRAEVLLLRPSEAPRYDVRASRWRALVKPGRKIHAGDRIAFGELGEARVVRHLDDGVRELELALAVPFEEFLARSGSLPLPPYVRDHSHEAQRRYQTIFAREPGSVAAPTASLHFTPPLFDALADRGVRIVKLVLDVGLGTFRPMQGERLDGHVMHGETYAIPQSTVDAVERARAEGRRIVAVGTTVMRALEGNVAEHGRLRAGPGETAIFIKPGFPFCVVDALVTNFHLPQSTLFVLVSAFAGRERMQRAYAIAMEREYRFFSFGDAMLLAPAG
ncbi:MAG: tRNA preQ1(34) S-adenosylmethionine ribosyltransferase-isomerase QueA, partial [Rhodanobacteraceae bacterium]